METEWSSGRRTGAERELAALQARLAHDPDTEKSITSTQMSDTAAAAAAAAAAASPLFFQTQPSDVDNVFFFPAAYPVEKTSSHSHSHSHSQSHSEGPRARAVNEGAMSADRRTPHGDTRSTRFNRPRGCGMAPPPTPAAAREFLTQKLTKLSASHCASEGEKRAPSPGLVSLLEVNKNKRGGAQTRNPACGGEVVRVEACLTHGFERAYGFK